MVARTPLCSYASNKFSFSHLLQAMSSSERKTSNIGLAQVNDCQNAGIMKDLQAMARHRSCNERSFFRFYQSFRMESFTLLFFVLIALFPVSNGEESINRISLTSNLDSRQLDVSRNALSTTGFVNSETCWENLRGSDENQDGFMNRAEYVKFVQLESIDVTSFFEDIDSFDNLPLALRLAYTTISCLCSNPDFGGDKNDAECCTGDNALIMIPGSNQSVSPPVLSRDEEAYLYATCVLTSSAVLSIVDSLSPTMAPVLQPFTSAPTSVPLLPTAIPSLKPTSDLPTVTPVAAPTTLSPTTLSPTSLSPTIISTTDSPSALPLTNTPSFRIATSFPSTIPSQSPFKARPTLVPSLISSVPSSSLTQTPSIKPSSVVHTNATVKFQIAIRNGTALVNSTSFVTEYLSNLQLAMNRLALELANANFDERRHLTKLTEITLNLQKGLLAFNQYKRFLQKQNVRLELPTELQQVSPIPCSEGPLVSLWGEDSDKAETILLDDLDYCQNISAVIRLSSETSTLSELRNISSNFENNLYNSIYDGEYQKQLDNIYMTLGVPNPLVVLTGFIRPEPTLNPNANNTVLPPVDDTFSSGAIAAITLGAVLGILVPIALFLSRRNRAVHEDSANKKPPDYQEYEADGDGADDLEMMATGGPGNRVGEFRLPNDGRQSNDGISVAESQYTDFAVRSTGSFNAGATALGAAPMPQSTSEFHGKGGSKKVKEAMRLEESDNIVAESGVRLMDDKDDSSSNAGSSGWSSSAGISSLNTGSIDDSSDIAAAAGATLAGIGLASATFRQQHQRAAAGSNKSTDYNIETTSGDDDDSIENNNNNSHTKVSGKLQSIGIGESEGTNSADIRDQLDSLIESGDWAAVGATAALLAAASDSQSVTTGISKNSRSALSDGNSTMSVDAARAAELDHLVDAGDWEGVVLAAAKFEAATGSTTGDIVISTSPAERSKDSQSRSSSSSQDSSSDDSVTGTGTFTGTFDPSLSTSVSDDPSRAARIAEYRAEVEALVRRVVPEEIDNVDEMMNQFKGREEELVETLRTMQERAAAQKARQATQKNAKLEARRTVQRGVVPGADAVAQRLELYAQPTLIDSINPEKTEATTNVTIEETDRFVATQSIVPSSSIGDKQAVLDEAIEAGNWTAAAEVAGMLSGSSATSMSSGEIDRLANTNYSTTSTEGSEHSRKRQLTGVNADRAAELDAIIEKGDWNAVVSIANRFTEEDNHNKVTTSSLTIPSSSRMSKEEEDALREAELWMKIAEQKKAEGANDAGASDAAEWAIQRSLSQLREAEKKSKSRSSSSLKYHHSRHGEDEEEV